MLCPTTCDVIAVLVVAMAVTSSSCPYLCTCTDSVHFNCRSRSLNDTNFDDVIYQFPANSLIDVDLGGNLITTTRPLQTDRLQIRRLLFDNCQLKQLERQAFHHMHYVEQIDLSNNIIDHIHKEAFRGLRALRQLSLSSNRLSTLEGQLFHGLTLDSLSIDNNIIEDIDNDAFHSARITSLAIDNNRLSALTYHTTSPLVDSIRTLTISNNSNPLRISSDALQGFSLSLLDVSASKLDSLSFLESIASVETLLVGGNQFSDVIVSWSTGLALTCQYVGLNDVGLESVSAQLMSSLRSVTTIDLSGNKLTDIDPVVFKRVPNLRHLDLSRNHLTTISPDFGVYLSRLERLNLSSNTMTSLSAELFVNMDKLRELDLSKNLLQTLPQSLMTVTSLSWLDVSSNRLYCNCELRWFREWVESRHGGDVVQAGVWCSGPSYGGLLTDRIPTDFQCTKPKIISVTSSTNVREGRDVLLSCTAQSDPAPSVTWSSPTNEVVTITPSDDRSQRRLSAIWQLRRARGSHSGWYECIAANEYGNSSAYTYLNVVITGGKGDSIDVASLVHSNQPRSVTTTHQYTDHSLGGTTSLVADNTINTSTGTQQSPSTEQTTVTNDVITSFANNVTSETSRSTDVWSMTSQSYLRRRNVIIGKTVTSSVAIVAACGGVVISVISLLVVCVFCRRHKRSGKYPIAHSSGVTVSFQCCCYLKRTDSSNEECKLNMSTVSTRSTTSQQPSLL